MNLIPLFAALLITIIIEFVVYFIIVRKNPQELLLYSVLINSFTNPLANIANGFLSNFLLIEAIVIIVEILLINALFKIDYKKAALISVLANIVSAIIPFIFIFF